MNYRILLLNKLIDKYEESPIYTGQYKTIKDVTLKFTERVIPDYFKTTSSEYEVINNVCIDLELNELINITWRDGQKGHIIEKITLNINKANYIYEHLNRREMKDIKNEIIDILTSYKGKHLVSDTFIGDMINRIREDKSLNKLIDIYNANETKLLLEGLIGVLLNDRDIFKRNLSILIYKDSKMLEAYEKKIVKILKTYHYNADEFDEETDVLEEFNVFKNPLMINIKGDIQFNIKPNEYPIRPFQHGIGINSKDVDEISFIDNDKVFDIITIENLTTFNSVDLDDAVLIYIGGFHNYSTRNMLKRLKESYKNAKFYHWGDIDCGGFRIFKHLKEKTNIDFEPYNMNKETYLAYKEYGKPLSKTELRVLNSMKNKREYNVFKDLIDTMIETGIKIEQESLMS